MTKYTPIRVPGEKLENASDVLPAAQEPDKEPEFILNSKLTFPKSETSDSRPIPMIQTSTQELPPHCSGNSTTTPVTSISNFVSTQTSTTSPTPIHPHSESMQTHRYRFHIHIARITFDHV